MSFVRRSAVVAVAGVALVVPGSPADASDYDAPSGGDTILTYAFLPGYSNPPGTGKSENPCADDDTYFVRVSEATSEVKNTEGTIAVELASSGDDTTYVYGWTGEVGWELPIGDTFDVEWVGWRTACAAEPGEDDNGDPLPIEEEPGSESRFWIRRPTQGNLVPGLVAGLADDLVIPKVTWPDADDDNGWIFVKAPMDFRIEPVSPLRQEISVSNLAGSATAWAVATPAALEFLSGEPSGGAAVCSYSAAIAPYVRETPGACSYRYFDSSAVSPTGFFKTTMNLWWDVTSSDPTRNDPRGRSYQDANIPVAEIQAIEVYRPKP